MNVQAPPRSPWSWRLPDLLLAEPIEKNYFGTKNTFLQLPSIGGEKWQTSQNQAGSPTGKCDRKLTHSTRQHLGSLEGRFLREALRFSRGGWGTVVIIGKGSKENKTAHSESVNSKEWLQEATPVGRVTGPSVTATPCLPVAPQGTEPVRSHDELQQNPIPMKKLHLQCSPEQDLIYAWKVFSLMWASKLSSTSTITGKGMEFPPQLSHLAV